MFQFAENITHLTYFCASQVRLFIEAHMQPVGRGRSIVSSLCPSQGRSPALPGDSVPSRFLPGPPHDLCYPPQLLTSEIQS